MRRSNPFLKYLYQPKIFPKNLPVSFNPPYISKLPNPPSKTIVVIKEDGHQPCYVEL